LCVKMKHLEGDGYGEFEIISPSAQFKN